MMKSDVVVILVNYNGGKDTLECVKSLHESEYPVDIIVVDNASTNGDPMMFEEYDNEKFHLILLNENLGFAGGNNIAIEYAIKQNYEYILLLNNDTIVDRNMVGYLREKSASKCVTVPLMLYYDEPSCIWFAGGEISCRTGRVIHCFGDKQVADVSPKLIERKCTFATGCCIMLATETIKNIGVMDESFFMYAEDLEYSIRLLENSVDILFVPKAKLWHKVGKSSGGMKSNFSIYYNTRNNLRIIRQNKKFFKSYAVFVFIIIKCRYVLKCLLRKQNFIVSYIRGIIDAYRNVEGKI